MTGLSKAWLGRFGELASSEHVHDEYASINHTHDITALGGLKGNILIDLTTTSDLTATNTHTYKLNDSTANYNILHVIIQANTTATSTSSSINIRFDGIADTGGYLTLTAGAPGYSAPNHSMLYVTSWGIWGMGVTSRPGSEYPSSSRIPAESGAFGSDMTLYSRYTIAAGLKLLILGIKF